MFLLLSWLKIIQLYAQVYLWSKDKRLENMPSRGALEPSPYNLNDFNQKIITKTSEQNCPLGQKWQKDLLCWSSFKQSIWSTDKATYRFEVRTRKVRTMPIANTIHLNDFDRRYFRWINNILQITKTTCFTELFMNRNLSKATITRRPAA